MKHVWAYMLLGQVVAISVASNLFFYAVVTGPKPSSPQVSQTSPTQRVSPVLWLSVVLSLATVAYSPSTTESSFLPNLLVMHALLVVPLIISFEPWTRFNIKLRTLYGITALVTLVLHLKAGTVALMSLSSNERRLTGVINAIVKTLYYHPAQSSIGWDIVWTTASTLVWKAYASSGSGQGLQLTRVTKGAVVALVGSVGVVFTYDGDAPAEREKVH